MDNNLLCPSHKCDLMKLLPILMDIDTDEEIILLPSQLNKELQMSTEERLTRLCKPTRKYRINTEVNTFSRTPDIIVFQNFQPGLLYKTTLSFLNLHPVSRHLRVVTGNSPYFEIDGPINDCSAKLAPGISYTLNVVFLPTEYRNYIHHITIITDTETFSVPVYGLTGQALLNLPDRILLPSTAVNVTSKKKLVLHNFGRTAASFIISLKDPFSVSPYKHLLPAGEFIELIITCKSSNVGHIEDCMHFSYNNIKLMVYIECEVYSLNTYLDKDSISFQDIYMGLKRQETVIVYNRSDHFVDFKWKLHKSFAVDQLETSNMITNLEEIKEWEKKRSTKLERMNVIDHEGHSRIYDKLFEDEVAELKSNNLLLYKNIAFDILPLEGKIFPNKSQTFTVTFAPNKNEHYESWAYLDATGSIDRIPLHLCGTGRGPYVSLNVKVLNIGDVFLCATHNYEIALKNEGNIPATIVFKDLITDFDGIIKCVPKKVYLPYQDSCSAFIMSFYSEFKGTFIETIQFVVKESGETIQFVLTGNVVCPLLKMDIQGIDFGRFPFGEQQSKKFLLKNECQVPIDFKIVLEGNISADSEIEFEPNRGVVDAYTDQLVSVQLNIFQSKEVNRNFKVIMWGSEQYSFSKFIKYTCISPTIICDPPEIKIKFCFINFEYKRTIVLKNQDNVSGAITYTPPEESENDDVICTLNKTNFMIHPNQCEEIELSLQTNALGINEMPLVFTVAGNEPQELCRILLDGQGPVISYRPEEINFNEITLLCTVMKELTLGNDSPIPATVRISKPPESIFNVDIDEIDILPDEEKVINVSVYLVDVGKYADIINVKVENGESIDIKVFGEGVGHSLLCEPTLNSEYDLEELLTFQHFTLPIKMTNLGRRYYKVRWTSNSSIKHLKDKLEEPNADYCFRIKPEYFELSHLQSQLFEIQGHSKLQKHVAEEFFCYALINKLSKMCLVMSLTIKARFVEPSLTIKKPLLDVLVVENDCIEIEDQMSIVNNLTIPVNVNLSTNDDYFIWHRESYQKNIYQKIEGNSEFCAKVKFSPNLSEKRYFKRTGLLTINYVNHPKTVSLNLSTEVCFPTVNLTESQLEFSFVPLNSYSFKNVIIQNLTFLPAKYSWEILEEFFEIEKLPLFEDESDLSDDLCQYLDDLPPKAAKKRKETLEDLFTSREEIQSTIGLNVINYTTEMKNVLLPTVQRFVPVCNEQYLFEDTNSIANYDEYKIRNILTIEPFRGQLDAYEYGIVTIGFFPPPNTRIRAKAICRVEGGEYETLSIVGTSCKVSYNFNKKYVDFGIQLFCEICENTIVLTNNGYCLFNYLITCDDIQEEGADLEPGWLYVSPNSGTLLPSNSTTLTIRYFPGKVGQFSRSFRVVIGYLDPFEIKIHGFAVFSQVFAYIPRPLINDQPADLSYKAISILSMSYLRRVNEISTVKNTSNHSLDPEVLSKLSEDDWVVISKDDYYPSTTDIHLSIERLLLAQLLMENPNILHSHTFTRKVKIIPEFKTPPYQLDFGYVVVETSVCYTVKLLNYGPTVTDVKLMKNGLNMEKNKFRIEYSPKKLEVGETINLHVIFHPTLKRYQQPDVNIKEKFSLIVAHGATIPMLINATVTLPRLAFNFKFINFGTVQIGQCLRKHLMIKNDGHVPCKWKVECRKKYTYFVSPTEGELLPGNNDILDVYFMPTEKDYLSGKLNIYIEGNPMKTSIQLCGYGIGVGLVFNCSMLKFRSALPYTNDSIIIFIVQNVSDRPVEFCFADYNQQYAQEKLWINTYFNSNNVKSMLVPERNAGHKLHNIFEDNYLIYVNELRKKLLKMDQYDSEDSETNDEISEELVDPLLKYSHNEISKMLNELIESKQTPEDSGSTDIPEINETFPSKMTILEPETDKTSVIKKPQNGIFIIFHGGPNTEYFKAANWAGLRLKIPIYSIDRLIYETLVENSGYSANEINRLIDEKFEYTANEEDLDPVPGEDEYDTLMRKVYVILYTTKRTKSKNAKGKAAEKGNKTSDKSSTNKSTKKDKDFNTLGDISLELFEDLLKYKFRSFLNGVIIESLHSEFLRKINIALNSLLTAIGNAKYIHIILLSYTLQNYIKEKEDKVAEEERIAEELKATGKEITKEKSQSKTFKKFSRETSTSGKSSKKSKKPQKEKLEKTLLKDMPKNEKDAFDSFQELLIDTFDLCQFWDKRGGFRNKTGTRSLKSESKDDPKDLKSTQQKKKICHEETSDEIGIFLWVISHANQERPINFSDIIYTALKENPDLQEAKKDLAEGIDVRKDSVLFTIMTKPDNSDTGKSNFFTISTNDQITDRGERRERDNESHGTKSTASLLSTKGISSRKKTSKHHKMVEEKINHLTREIDVPFDIMSRRILEPEEVAYYTFTFSPNKCGEYNHNFTVQITGLNSDFVLNCNGICELPTIDFNPHVMFPNVLECFRDKDVNTNFVYIKEMNVLDFGLVFFDADNPHKYEYHIVLKNISRLPCEVKASLDAGTSYSLPLNLLHVDPDQEMLLPISVKATKPSILESDLCISVKNNPVSKLVKLVTKPCKVDCHIKPKILTFDKVPVNCSLQKKISLCNLSPVNLLWKFVDFHWALQIFQISKTEGFLGPFSVFDVTFSYTPLREESYSKKQLVVQLFDINYSDEVPLYVDSLTLHADSVECIVEYSDHIDLGDIKGGQEHKISYTLMNKGQHNTCITFSKIDNPLDKYNNVQKCFNLMNTSEILYPNKLFTGTLTFNPLKPMEFVEVPIFVCNFIECMHPENVMKSIVIKISAKVFFSSFEISPSGDINFGHQQISSTKAHTLELKNTGRFPLSYTITYVNPEELTTEKSVTKKSKTGTSGEDKASKVAGNKKSKESKEDKKKSTKLNAGCFSIQPSIGEVMPNDIAHIEIECYPKENEEYKEVISLSVSESLDEEIHIMLTVIGCEPKMDFHNFRRIFKEHYIVDKLEVLDVPKITANYCIYESSEQTLHFKKVSLDTKAVSNIYMQNTGHVIAYVTTKIDDGNKNVFKVFPSSIDVDPFSTKSLSIIFKPECVGETYCKLEITYNSSTNNKFSVALIGEGVMPKLMLIKPNLEENNKSNIRFLPTYIGHSRTQRISIKNVCSISAKAILQIHNNVNEALTLIACEDTYSMLNICDSEEIQKTKYSTLVNLNPEETANFDLKYTPKCEDILAAHVKIHTVNNPFEVVQIAVYGRSYYHDIILEKLPPCHIEENNIIGYQINFNFAFLHYLQKKSFSIINNSEEFTYKFEFTNLGPLAFIPRVGHLKPLTNKEIIISFCTRKPLHFDKDLVKCTINKIEYVNPDDSDALTWDERHKYIAWEVSQSETSDLSSKKHSKASYEEETEECCEDARKSVKNIIARSEPEFRIIPETSDIIPCLLSVTADYSTYINKVSDINFPDTYINEKTKRQFEIENNGVVPLKIEWNFTNVKTVETRATSAVEKKDEVNDAKNDLITRPISANFLFTSESSHLNVKEIPFTISPQKTLIYPSTTQEFTIQFWPLNLVNSCMNLQSNIVGLKPKMKNINIKVTGKSLTPIYYFELEQSNYMSRRPDGVKKCNVPDYVDSKVIEFESVGVGVLSLRKFCVVNPGNKTFTYKFESLEKYPPFSYFDCKASTGVVKEGKKSEIIFTFKSHAFGNFEGYYTFQIPDEKISVPFLLAGRCREPHVYFTRSHISLKPTVLNVPLSTKITLWNEEYMELSFKFHKESFFNDNQDQELNISPKKGKLRPHSEQIIEVTFKAEKIGDTNFFVLCTVENVPAPLTLNISAQCEEVVSLITYWDKSDAITKTLDKDKENIINFGMITPKKKETLEFSVSNKGKTGFFYTVQLNAKPVEHFFCIDVSQQKEFVASNKTSSFIMSLEAQTKATLKNFKVKINISYGPTYLLSISAKAESPLIKLSFQSYNFGYCIVQKSKSTYYDVTLEIKNIGTRVVMLENLFEDSDDLTIDFKNGYVQPSSTQHLTIYFHPMNVGRYEINVPLKVNLLKYIVKIMGEAVNVNLQLVKGSDKYIDLGQVLVGTAKRYGVQVINKTPTNINVFFDVWEKLPFHTRPKEKIYSEMKLPDVPEPTKEMISNPSKIVNKKRNSGESTKGSTKESKKESKESKEKKKLPEDDTKKTSKKSQNVEKNKSKDKKKNEDEVVQDDILELLELRKSATDFLKISPKNYVQIAPDKKFQFSIEFMPTERLESFTEKIFYEIQDHIEPLCVVTGYCFGPKFLLSQKHLKFSNVVMGLTHTAKTLLRNMGDFKGRFQFKLDKRNDIFRITPLTGFVGPSSELEICVTFAPKTANCIYKTKANCLIGGLEKPLQLILEGSSTKIPSPISTLQFQCPVRERTQEQIKIVNITKERWIIHSFISSDQFSTEKEFIVEPDAEYVLDVTYKPEIMTSLTPHNATLFLSLPEGKAIIYKLVGETLPPLPINKISLDVKCKMYNTHALVIRNWMNTKQSFIVTTELMTPLTPKCLYKVSGNSIVELFPNEHKNYNWKVYIVNEIPLDFKVIFTNIETKEYMYYEISVNVLPSDPVETKVVVTCVRKPVNFTVILENPIDHPVTFTVECDLAESIFDQYVTLEPYTKHHLPFQYCPLKSDEITTYLYAICPELGTYTYCLKLIAKPPLPENTVRFKAELGEKVYRAILWKNTFKAPVEFTAKFDHPVFSLEKVSPIPEGESGRLKFGFEPSQLGVLQSKAIVFSPQTGNYVYPLIGECVLPTPKGPFVVKPGGSTQINFVNPFMEDQTFNFYIDSNAFYLKTTSETIKAKKSTKIVVNMQALKYLDGNVQPREITAKLHVEVAGNSLDHINWVFYIQSEV